MEIKSDKSWKDLIFEKLYSSDYTVLKWETVISFQPTSCMKTLGLCSSIKESRHSSFFLISQSYEAG